MHHASDNAIVVNGLTRRFGATVALDGASFEVRRGDVHALLGENGAGKSTAVKILSGLLQPDEGVLTILGGTTTIRNPRHAHELGIQTAFQEMTLVPDLTVTQNLLLPYEPVSGGQIRRRRALARARSILDELDMGHIDPRVEVRDLDLPQRQKIEIAKTVAREPRILLLDEPTSALSGSDVDWLGELIGRLKARGVTIIFISHRMPEVRMFCDRLSILRNGRHVGTHQVAELSDDEVVEKVVGHSLVRSGGGKRRAEPDHGDTVLEGRDLKTDGHLHGVSFSLRAGEILGVSALQGMGQLDLFLALFGMRDLAGGEVRLDGQRVTLASPRDAVRSAIGISLLPEDRRTEGLFIHLSGQANVSLPVIDRFTRFGWIHTRMERHAVDAALAQVNVHPRALYKPVSSFSGGNQQKIALAKWLLAGSRVLLMFDPTRGVDVGTKEEIYTLMRAFADDGGAILFYSTEIPELVTQSDRVLGVYRGRIVDELSGDAITEENILRSVIGHDVVAEQARAMP